MLLESEELHRRLNDSEIIGLLDNDNSNFWYKQGYLRGLLKALVVVEDYEYYLKHGRESREVTTEILGEMDNDTAESLKNVIEMVSEKIAEQELSSHSEKDIVKGCISLMQELYDAFLEYLDFMDIKWEHEEEMPVFNFSYFHIVQQLLLYNTRHSGGTSTRAKCNFLGFAHCDNVTFEPEEEDEDG